MRKCYSKDFKAKVALEALREGNSLTELSKMYDVHPNIIRKWKENALEGLPDVFARGKSQEQKDFESKEAEYLKTIGQLTMERDFLQKAFTKIQPELKKTKSLVNSVENIPVKRQCELIELPRSSFYSRPQPPVQREGQKLLKDALFEIHETYPFYGYRKAVHELRNYGVCISPWRARIVRNMLKIRAIYPGPHTSSANKEHEKYPYLLRGLKIIQPNQVWATDITYIRTGTGFMYLVAILDLYIRRVLSHRLCNTLSTKFCAEALKEALITYGQPEIFNTDQGSQFTSDEWISILKSNKIQISMDGKGRALDNVYVERLWRSLKYENIYLNDYDSVPELRRGIAKYFSFYNSCRFHQALEYLTPDEVYFEGIRQAA